MRYAAIVLLAVLGLVEFLVRSIILLAAAISVVGLIIFFFVAEKMEDPAELIQPYCFEIVAGLLAEGPVKDKQIQDLERKLHQAQIEKQEMQSLLVAHDMRGD
jgi:hypothetical protein